MASKTQKPRTEAQEHAEWLRCSRIVRAEMADRSGNEAWRLVKPEAIGARVNAVYNDEGAITHYDIEGAIAWLESDSIEPEWLLGDVA